MTECVRTGEIGLGQGGDKIKEEREEEQRT